MFEVAYPILASVFFLSIFIFVLFVVGLLFQPLFWQINKLKIKIFCAIWFVPYAVFIMFFTGPTDLALYPQQAASPYKLPWKAGVSRFVAQGNRSFTSHRAEHMYAWDFVMPNGTEILAASSGRVLEVEASFDGIGLNSNYLIILHKNGERSTYAHIRHQGALVKTGDVVQQGQPIALSGMVGQTIFPHVHFYVLGKDSTVSVPVSFSDVSDGVPMAGRFYTSENRMK